MKEKILNNFGLKIVSLILAFVIWMGIVNISNPIVPGLSYTIPVEVRNEGILDAANLTYHIDEKDSVTVNYSVRTRNSSLLKPSDFSASIDLSDYNDVTGAVPVTVEINKNKENLIVDGAVVARPMVLHITTEALVSQTYQLKPMPDGKPEDGYAFGQISLQPDSVTVRGPESLVTRIASAGAPIKADNSKADLEGDTMPVFFDSDGKALDFGDKVKVTPEKVQYRVPVLRAKNLALNFEVKGTVANGYRYTGAECDKKTIPVVGTKSVLASVNTLSISDSRLSVDGATSDRVIHLDLKDYLPPDTAIAGDGDSLAAVTLKVEPLTTKIYSLDLNGMALKGNKPGETYTCSQESVDVTVRGLKEDLDALDKKDLNTVLDVTGLNEGTYPGKLAFKLGEGFEVLNYSDFDVTVAPDEDGEKGQESETDSQPSSDQSAAASSVQTTEGHGDADQTVLSTSAVPLSEAGQESESAPKAGASKKSTEESK